jgi:hypothetical protein
MSKTTHRLAQSPIEGPWHELSLTMPKAQPAQAPPEFEASSPVVSTPPPPLVVVAPWWTQSQYTLPLAAALLGCTLVGWALWQKIRARRVAKQTAGAAVGGEVMLERELVDLTDQLVHQLDDRTKQLELLLARADKRSTELEVALKDAQHQLRAARQHATASQIEAKPVARMGLDSHPHQEVYDLADQGFTPVQIAQRLARHTGHVELILNLRRAGA